MMRPELYEAVRALRPFGERGDQEKRRVFTSLILAGLESLEGPNWVEKAAAKIAMEERARFLLAEADRLLRESAA